MKNILVLDTETTGDFGQPLIYDFGYKIINPKGQVLFVKNAIVREVFENRFIMDKAYYAEKIKKYQEMISNHEIEVEPYHKIIREFITVARKYKVEVISAYNLAFDIRAINGTMKMCYSQGDDDKILEKLINQKNKKLLCIWNLACETILDTDEYREFAKLNGKISEKGNYLTNAEVTYQYITQNLGFIEDHTALSDVNIEIDILLHILENYEGNLTYGLHYGSWRKVQK
jgi:transposase-like protein